jgi:hypothetical protein
MNESINPFQEGAIDLCWAAMDDELYDQPLDALRLTQKFAPKYVSIRDMPCRLTNARLKPKATARGNDRVELEGEHRGMLAPFSFNVDAV